MTLPKQQLSELQKIATPWPASKPKIQPSASKWFNRDHEVIFRRLCRKKPNGLYLELGTWTGMGSTKYIADRYPAMTMICVDTFEGSEEHRRIEAYNKVRVKLWDHFCANHWKNRKRLYPVRSTTIEGMEQIAKAGLSPHLIYVDAAHDEDSVYNDIRTALKCFPRSIIMGDDYSKAATGHPGVRLGIERAIDEKLFAAKEFKNHRRVWYLTRNTQ